MSHFCLLSSPQDYVADKWDLAADESAREYWLDHFAGHFKETLAHALGQYGRSARSKIDAAGKEFAELIEGLARHGGAMSDGQLNVLSLCRLRAEILRKHGLDDPFRHVKQRENASAVQLYDQVVSRHGALEGLAKWLSLVEGVFAGNIFDLGSESTMHLAAEPTDFFKAVEGLKSRPWCVDDFDRLAQDLPESPPTDWSKAVVFIDNSGSDFVLGVMPLVRELALYGTKIVLAANELPSLNDMTVDETVVVVEQLAARDDDLAALIRADMFEVVSSGNDMPVLDLSEVSDELNEAAADADLLILVGMGRGVETNFDAEFKVDTLRLAMLKDQQVAARLGASVFDCVCKYAPAEDEA